MSDHARDRTSPTGERAARIASRRRAVVRVGFVILALCSATACIFDKSDYQGGGRLAQGATAQQSAEEPQPTQTTPTPTTTTPDTGVDTGVVVTDANDGG